MLAIRNTVSYIPENSEFKCCSSLAILAGWKIKSKTTSSKWIIKD